MMLGTKMISSGAALVAALLAQSAVAQTAPATATPANDTPSEQADIIVTATKTGGTLDRTPAAITAVSSDQLGAGRIQNASDLAAAVPNLSVGDQFGINRTFIRGIGLTSIDLGADGAVAFLQDGAMISRPAAQLAGFYDLQQVEVLRGPQGTIYGRGATAGAINMVTNKPTDHLDGYARFTYGNYNAKTFEGAIGGPIIGDVLMARLSGKIEKRDGYGVNLFTGNPVDDRNAQAARLSLLFKPSPTFNVLLVGDYIREHDNDYAFHYLGTTVVPESSLASSLLGGQTIFGYYRALGQQPNLRNIYSNEDAINRRKGYGATGTVSWTPGDLSVVSITAYRDFKRFNRDDLDVSQVNAFGQNNYTENSKTFSQEFTVNYKTGKLELLAGALYFHEKLFGEVRVPTTNLAAYFNIVLGTMLPPTLFDRGFYLQSGTVTTDAYGAYGQASYEIADGLKVTAGARYNYEKRAGVGQFTFDAQGLNIPTDKSRGWGAVTPKFLVEYTTGNTLLYASATRGFKSGVINVGSVNSVIDPEYVWSYETGFKLHTADRTFSLNGSAFYYDYKNLQVGFVNANNIVETTNAAAARNYGVELEAVMRPVRNVTFTIFGTYLNARFTDFCTGYYRAGVPGSAVLPPCPTNPALVSLKGNQLPNAPKYTVGVVGDYRIDLGQAGSLSLRGDMNLQADVFFTEFNNSDAQQDGFVLANASATWKPRNDRFLVSGWVRNLTNTYAIANNIVAAPLFGDVRVGSLRPPRTYGLTLGVDF